MRGCFRGCETAYQMFARAGNKSVFSSALVIKLMFMGSYFEIIKKWLYLYCTICGFVDYCVIKCTALYKDTQTVKP